MRAIILSSTKAHEISGGAWESRRHVVTTDVLKKSQSHCNLKMATHVANMAHRGFWSNLSFGSNSYTWIEMFKNYGVGKKKCVCSDRSAVSILRDQWMLDVSHIWAGFLCKRDFSLRCLAGEGRRLPFEGREENSRSHDTAIGTCQREFSSLQGKVSLNLQPIVALPNFNILKV
jgi:hypothetical protein